MTITIYSKPFFRRCFRPVADRLARAGITPNQITVSNIAVSLAAGMALLANSGETWPLFVIPAALSVRLVFNHVDGLLALESAHPSHFLDGREYAGGPFSSSNTGSLTGLLEASSSGRVRIFACMCGS